MAHSHSHGPLRVGGPVDSGKTLLMEDGLEEFRSDRSAPEN
jgi:Ni2+-binding GTPase involved in maturation of urease and hydrogenase